MCLSGQICRIFCKFDRFFIELIKRYIVSGDKKASEYGG
ncbi:hypothetical protein appser6_18670 [Actinobacillus pleuropneumoniae serovar 6 str. Femo]|uniref:Uncharacterized protein n=1 Tax=Actinobacillus pleuropneumoniae serovar 6 str. Femo TaxID=754256 RepID=A0A828PPE3_ACTPL|nr:hypothetical protein appser6_18670 [Actinobacillus pleuropneumoniae serovar 6 str. Femo]